MRYPKVPVRIEMAGMVNAQVPKYGDGLGGATIPVNTLRKLIATGQVAIECGYSYTEDYAWDAATNFGKGSVDPDWFADFELRSPLQSCGRSYLEMPKEFGKPANLRISFGRHSNECYYIRPIDGQVTVTLREVAA